jgi:ArsR family transcriptional regulator
MSTVRRHNDPDVLLLQGAADPTRLSILRQLSDLGEVCACDLGRPSISQPTLSHHLRVLREAGWVTGERRGTWIWYSLRPEAVARFQQLAGLVGAPVAASDLSPRRLTVVQPTQ